MTLALPPYPIVDEILACKQDWVDALQGFWRFAQTNDLAFEGLERSIEEDLLITPVDVELAGYVRRLLPKNVPDEFDPYTMVLLKEVWDLACKHPSALEDLLQGLHHRNMRPMHRKLAWSMRKLQTNGDHRIRQRGHCPVANVPAEIIHTILEELRMAYPRYRPWRGQDIWDRASYLASRAVCMRWKSLADLTPSLWVPILFDFGPILAELALGLSGSFPLDIIMPYVKRTTRFGPSTAKLMAYLPSQHLSRVRKIDITTRSWGEAEQILNHLTSSSLPCLESFTFKVRSNARRNDYRALTIGPAIFGSTPPSQLRAVTVADLAVSPASLMLASTLVELELMRSHVWSTLDDMLDTIASLQALEKFSWRMSQVRHLNGGYEARPPFASFSVSNRERVGLCALKALVLECPIECTAAILSHIITPKSCALEVLDDSTLPDGEDDHALDSLITGLRTTVGNHLQRAALAPNMPQDGYQVSMTDHPLSSRQRPCLRIEGCSLNERTDLSPPPSFSITIFLSNQPIDVSYMASLLQEILCWPVVCNATRLYTNNPGITQLRIWPLFLGMLPSVRCIVLAQNDQSEESGEWEDASLNIAGLTQALGSHDHLAPVLSRIVIRGLDFEPSVQRKLAFAVRSRYLLGHPMVAVSITDSDVDIERLRGILQWDGAGMLYYEQTVLGSPQP